MVRPTADVHRTAAHRYDPARARFRDFHPFWGFVGSPLHAGTFGLEVVWHKARRG